MRKELIVAFALAAMLPAAAQEQRATAGAEAQHSEHEQHSRSTPDGGSADSPQATHGMHEHMQAMREQMARIHAAQDPEERQRLMHQHMQSMHEHMAMMQRREQHSEQGAQAAERCAAGDMRCRMSEMQSQQTRMQARMVEMQQMMDQMMQHLAERSADDERRSRRR
jgi:hypothetical protein